MPLITQSKTNWKFLTIVIILAAVAGGQRRVFTSGGDLLADSGGLLRQLPLLLLEPGALEVPLSLALLQFEELASALVFLALEPLVILEAHDSHLCGGDGGRRICACCHPLQSTVPAAHRPKRRVDCVSPAADEGRR